MQKIIDFAARFGVTLRVDIAADGTTWIGFADSELRLSSRKKGGAPYKPAPAYGRTVDAAFADFVRRVRGRELSWPGHNIDDNYAVRVPRNLAA